MLSARRPTAPDGVPRRTLPVTNNVPLSKREEGIKRVIISVMKRTGEFPWDAHSAIFRTVGEKIGLIAPPAPDVTVQPSDEAKETLVADAARPAEAAPVAPEPPVHTHAIVDPALFPNRQGVSSNPTPMEIDAGAEVDEGRALEPVISTNSSGESGVPIGGLGLPSASELAVPDEAPFARNDGGSGPTGDLTGVASAVVTGETPPVQPSALINEPAAQTAQPRALTLQDLPIDAASAETDELVPQGSTTSPNRDSFFPLEPDVTSHSYGTSLAWIRAALADAHELRERSRAIHLMRRAIDQARRGISTVGGQSCTLDRAYLIVRAFRAARTGIEQINAFLRYYYYTRYPAVASANAYGRSETPGVRGSFHYIVTRVVGPNEDIQPGSRAWVVPFFRGFWPQNVTRDNQVLTGDCALLPVQPLSQAEVASIRRSFPDDYADLTGFSYAQVDLSTYKAKLAQIRPAPDVARVLHQVSDLILTQVSQTRDFDFSTLASVGFVSSYLASARGSANPISLVQAFGIACENSLGWNPREESLLWALARAGVQGASTVVQYVTRAALGAAVGDAQGAVLNATAALLQLGENAVTSTLAEYGSFSTQTSLAPAVYMFTEQLAMNLPVFMDEESFVQHLSGFFTPGSFQIVDAVGADFADFLRIRKRATERQLSNPSTLLWYTYAGDAAFSSGNYHPFANSGVTLKNAFINAPGWETLEERRGTVQRVSGALGAGFSLSSVRLGAGCYLGDLFGFIEQKNGLRPPNDTRRPASFGASLDAINAAIASITNKPQGATSVAAAAANGAVQTIASIAQSVNTIAISGDRTSIDGIETALAREQKQTLELAAREAQRRPDEPDLSALGVNEVEAPSHPLNSLGGNRLFTGDDVSNPLVAYRIAVTEHNDAAERLIFDAPSLARAPQSVNDGFFGKRFIVDMNVSAHNYLLAARPPVLKFAASDVRERAVPLMPSSRSAQRVRQLAPPPDSHAFEFSVAPFDAARIAHFGVSSSPANDLVRLVMSAEGVTGSLAASVDEE